MGNASDRTMPKKVYAKSLEKTNKKGQMSS